MSVSRHVGRHFEITAEGVRFLDLTRAAVAPLALARAVPDCAVERLRGVGAGAHLHRAEHRAVRPGRFHGDRRRPAAGQEHALPAPGPLRPPDRDARLRAARPRLSRVRPHSRPRHPRLLPQVHRRRAHAPGHPRRGIAVESHESEPAAVQLDPPGAARAGAADARAALSRRRQVARCRARAGERPARAEHARSARAADRRAPDGRVPHPQSPAHVAGRLPARFRRPARRQAVRRPDRHRRNG